jgi:hypothetical protein
MELLTIPEGLEVDLLFKISFEITDSNGNFIDNWTVEDGDPINDWANFFTLDSLVLSSDANTYIENPQDRFDFIWTKKSDANGYTFIEVSAVYKDMEEGVYTLSLATDGLKEWNDTVGNHYFFNHHP